MTMKKLISLLLVFIFLFGCVSCSVDDDDDSSEKNSGSERQEDPEKTGGELRVLYVTDLHFSGTYEKSSVTGGSYLHSNSYWGESEFFGWDNETRLQMVMDELCAMYRRGEYDMVLFLGDNSRNDGCYRKFLPSDQRYWNNYRHNNTAGSYDESAAENGNAIAGTYFLGESLDEFWGSGFDFNYVLKEKYFSQLTDFHIPYFVAVGNHDWDFLYDYETGEVSWEPWENLYHYGDIFGYEPDNFLVRAVRMDGKVRIVTNLTDSELEKYHDAGYTYYTNASEMNRTSYEKIASVAVLNPFTYVYDPNVTSINVTGDITQYVGCNEEVLEDILSDSYDTTYLAAHLFSNGDAALGEALATRTNVKGIFYGDNHCEASGKVCGVPSFCVGTTISSLHFDTYPDASYFYCRSNSKNVVWGNLENHPWSFTRMHLRTDGYTDVYRDRFSGYYEEGLFNLTSSQMVGMDLRYTRATMSSRNAELLESLVFVGDNGEDLKMHVVYNGTKIEAYALNDANGTEVARYKTIAHLSFRDGNHILTIGGETMAKNGSLRYGNLYDETGLPVLVDADGKYVYVTAARDENRTPLRDYFYLAKDGTKKKIDLSVDATYTDVAVAGDHLTYDVAGETGGKREYYHEKSWYNVGTATITVKDGKITVGEGFCHYVYRLSYSYADGSAATPLVAKDSAGNDVYGFFVPNGWVVKYTLGK